MKIKIEMTRLEWDPEAEQLFGYMREWKLERGERTEDIDGHLLNVASNADGWLFLNYFQGPDAEYSYELHRKRMVSVDMMRALAALYEGQIDPLHLMPEEFTVVQLRKLHEAITGVPVQKDTFRRMVIGGLVATGEREISIGRPAELFRVAELVAA